jgi:hypothetical protein
MATYQNSFYRAEQHRNNPYIHPTITNNYEPVLYSGYEIFKKSDIEYHIVKDNICVSMVGSLRYAKCHIDCGLDRVKTSAEFKKRFKETTV